MSAATAIEARIGPPPGRPATGIATAAVPPARWILRGALLFALTFTNLNDIWSPDVIPNTLFAWTILRQGNADYDEFATGVPADGTVADPSRIARDVYFFRACGPGSRAQARLRTATSPRSAGGPPPPGPNDRVCSIFPPGISLLALPVLAPFVIAGASPADGALLIRSGHLAAAIVETLAALLIWSVLTRFTTARWALALVLLYWLGTSVRTVASQALWQHAGVHLAIAVALWLVLHERAVSRRRELLAGLALGLGVVVRQTTALIGLGAVRLGTLAEGPWSAAATLVVGLAFGTIPLFVYQQLVFGSAFETGYGPKPFDTPLLEGLYGLLLSPSRGLVVYEPWALAALASLALAWLRPGLVAARLRSLSAAWLALLVLYATYAEWWGGRVFGPRFLDDMAPVLLVALGWGIGQGLLARAWSRVAFWLAAAWSLLLFNAAALVYDPNAWDTLPLNVNFHPERLLDWSDPQWVSILASLASPDARVLAAAALSALILALLLRLELARS